MSSGESNTEKEIHQAIDNYNESVLGHFKNGTLTEDRIRILKNLDSYISGVISYKGFEQKQVEDNKKMFEDGQSKLLGHLGEVTKEFEQKATSIIEKAKALDINFGLNNEAIEKLKKLKGVGERDGEDKFESKEATEISDALIQKYLMTTEYKNFNGNRKQVAYFKENLKVALQEFWDKLEAIKADDGESLTETFKTGVVSALVVARGVDFGLTKKQIEKIKKIPKHERVFDKLDKTIQTKLQVYLETQARINGITYADLVSFKKPDLLNYTKQAFREDFEKFLQDDVKFVEEKKKNEEEEKEVERKIEAVKAIVLTQAESFSTKPGLQSLVDSLDLSKYKSFFSGQTALSEKQKTTYSEKIKKGYEDLLTILKGKLAIIPDEEPENDKEPPVLPVPASFDTTAIDREIEKLRAKRAKLQAKRPKWYNFFSGEEKRKVDTNIGKIDLEILKLQEQKRTKTDSAVLEVDTDKIESDTGTLSKRKLKAELKDDKDEYDAQIKERIVKARAEAKIKYDEKEVKRKELEARLKDRSLSRDERNKIEEQIKKIKEELKIEKRQDRKLWLEEAKRTKGVGKRLLSVVNEQRKNPATYWKSLWYGGLGVGIAALGVTTGGLGLAGLGMAALKGGLVGAFGKLTVGMRERYLDNRDVGEENKHKGVYSPTKLAKDFVVGGVVGAAGGALAKGVSEIFFDPASAATPRVGGSTSVDPGSEGHSAGGTGSAAAGPTGSGSSGTGGGDGSSGGGAGSAMSGNTPSRFSPQDFIINEGVDKIPNNRSLWDMLQKIGMTERDIANLYQNKGKAIATDVMNLAREQGLLTPEMRSAYREILSDRNITGEERFWSLFRDKLDLNAIIKKVIKK